MAVETQVLPIHPQQPETAVIQQAADKLRAGGLVAFPTETVYGLGANALDAEAIARIYQAKGRPANNPLIVHIASVDQLEQVAVEIPDVARRLAAAFWPGPLTLVLKRHARIPESVSLGRDTVAVRLPSHPVARALIEAAGVPVVAPSANRFTRPSATSAAHVLNDLGGSVDIILDGGPTPIGVESTVLDVTVHPPVLLRPGGVTLEALREHVPDVQRLSEAISMDDTEARPASPGMLSKHYSPQAELLLFSGPFEAVIDRMRQTARERIEAGQRVGLLVVDFEQVLFNDLNLHVSTLGSTPEQIAHTLFAALRDLDAQGVDVILARLMQPEGLGATINDRLLRAAEGKVIDV
jgi:L-threonylcarbamoyladenylate synthase